MFDVRILNWTFKEARNMLARFVWNAEVMVVFAQPFWQGRGIPKGVLWRDLQETRFAHLASWLRPQIHHSGRHQLIFSARPIAQSLGDRTHRFSCAAIPWCANQSQPGHNNRAGLPGHSGPCPSGRGRRRSHCCELTGVSSDRESDCTSPRIDWVADRLPR